MIRQYCFTLNILFVCISLGDIRASDKYKHHDGSHRWGSIGIGIKTEEESKLKRGSVYEFVTNLDTLSGILVHLSDVSNKLPWKSVKDFPVLKKEDLLSLRMVNKALRSKFLLVHKGAIDFDLAIKKVYSPAQSSNDTERVERDLTFKDKKSSMVCCLLQEGLLEATSFYFRKFNAQGFHFLVKALKNSPHISFSDDADCMFGEAENELQKIAPAWLIFVCESKTSSNVPVLKIETACGHYDYHSTYQLPQSSHVPCVII